MNTHRRYERHLDRTVGSTDVGQDAQAAPSLFVQRDPSRTSTIAGDSARPGGRGLAWVRLSELPAVLGTPAARRGIDLQTALVRRARRAPRNVIVGSRSALASHGLRTERRSKVAAQETGLSW